MPCCMVTFTTSSVARYVESNSRQCRITGPKSIRIYIAVCPTIDYMQIKLCGETGEIEKPLAFAVRTHAIMSASSGRHLVRGNQVHRPGTGDTGDAATIPDTAHAQNHQDVSTPRSPRMCARHQRAVLQVCRHLVRGNQAHQPIHVTSLFARGHTVTIGWPRETGEHLDTMP